MPSTDPGLFDGRLLIEIEAWDWALDVRLSPNAAPIETRFQGGLNYSRPIVVTGRIQAPRGHRGKGIRVWISPFGPELSFDAGLDRLGQLRDRSKDQLEQQLEARLYLPEGALGPALTALATVWRYIHLWTDEELAEVAGVTAFSFSADIPPRLMEWAGAGLSPASA